MGDLFGTITTGLASALAGGATGLLGTAVSSFIDFKKQKEQFKHKEKMHELELQMMQKEAELAIQKTQAEAEAEIEITHAVTEQQVQAKEVEGWLKSQALGNQALLTQNDVKPPWLVIIMGLVDALRAAIRPVLTILGTVMMVIIYFKVDELVDGINGGFDKAQLYELYRYLIYSFVYLTFTMVLWWFGTRSKVKTPELKKI